MNETLFARKGKQQQAFNEDRRIVVTQLHVEPTYVIGFRTFKTDGYWAIRLGYGNGRSLERVNKPLRGLLTAAGITAPLTQCMEIRISSSLSPFFSQDNTPSLTIVDRTYTLGMPLKASELFTVGDEIRVTGTSKGKGFQGVVKRHGFAGGLKTHGQSDRHRAPGSIGQRTIPGRVYKGKKMAGRMGGIMVTISGLRVEAVDDSLLTIRGLVPGGPRSIVQVIKIT